MSQIQEYAAKRTAWELRELARKARINSSKTELDVEVHFEGESVSEKQVPVEVVRDVLNAIPFDYAILTLRTFDAGGEEVLLESRIKVERWHNLKGLGNVIDQALLQHRAKVLNVMRRAENDVWTVGEPAS